MTSAYLRESASIALVMSSGDELNGSNANPARRSRTSGSANALATSALILEITALGVPRGASSATHALTSKLAGPPASVTVGTSGKPATRRGAATARNFTFLARYIGPAEAA